MTAKGCITFVTYQIILTHTGYSSYFTVGQCMAQNCPFLWRIQAPPNTWFLGPTRVHTPNGISIGSAVFVGIKVVSNRHTVTDLDKHAQRTRYIGTNRLLLDKSCEQSGTQDTGGTKILLLHPFNGLFPRATWVSQYENGKTNLDLNEARVLR